jgi:hypothetical protein
MYQKLSTQYPQLFMRGTFLIGFVPMLLGVNAILRPEAGLRVMRYRAPNQPDAWRLTQSLMRMYGTRNIMMGLSILGNWYFDQRQALAIILLAVVQVSVVDGFVSRFQIGGNEWGHWRFAPAGLVLAAGLLEWI